MKTEEKRSQMEWGIRITGWTVVAFLAVVIVLAGLGLLAVPR